MSSNKLSSMERATRIVSESGGKIIGRTKLQKIACLLELAGHNNGFAFEYRHYGPFSEDLASAIRDAVTLDMLSEKEIPTSWGGFYYEYDTERAFELEDKGLERLAKTAAAADSIELELAATAAFLKSDGIKDAWEETAKRKPEKAAEGRLEKSKSLYKSLSEIPTPKPLPSI